jgi:hypothetical protein
MPRQGGRGLDMHMSFVTAAFVKGCSNDAGGGW